MEKTTLSGKQPIEEYFSSLDVVAYKKQLSNVVEGELGPVIQFSGSTILHSLKSDDYKGESLFILQKDWMVGFVAVAYGSCESCDELKGCKDWKEVQAFYEKIMSSAVWFTRKEELCKWLLQKDWEIQPYYSDCKDRLPDFLNIVFKHFNQDYSFSLKPTEKN